jgi:hypothetical protein
VKPFALPNSPKLTIRLLMIAVAVFSMIKPAHALTEQDCVIIGSIGQSIIDKRAEKVPLTSIAKMTPNQLDNLFPASPTYDRFSVIVPYLLDRSLAHEIPRDRDQRRRLRTWFGERMERECQRAVLQAAMKN